MSLKKSFSNTVKVILLILICVLASFVLVWPLWKFSTSLPKLYTIIVSAILLALLLFLIIRKIIRTPVKSTISFFANLILITGAVVIPVLLVIHEKRLFALLAFAGFIVLICIFNVIFSKATHAE